MKLKAAGRDFHTILGSDLDLVKQLKRYVKTTLVPPRVFSSNIMVVVNRDGGNSGDRYWHGHQFPPITLSAVWVWCEDTVHLSRIHRSSLASTHLSAAAGPPYRLSVSESSRNATPVAKSSTNYYYRQ